MAREHDRLPDGGPAGIARPFEVEPPAEVEGFDDVAQPEILPPREPWRSWAHLIGLTEQAIGALLLAVILVLVIALIAQRYLPGANFPWTGEVARLAMVWATFAVAGYLASRDRHIAIHVVDYLLHGRALAVVKLMANAVVFATCLALLYATFQLLQSDVGQVTAAAGIPLLLVNAVPILGFALTALRAVLAIVVIDVPALTGRAEAGA